MTDMDDKAIDIRVNEDSLRLDIYLQNQDIGFSRSRIKHMILEGYIRVNGNECKVSHTVYNGDQITINKVFPKESRNVATDIPLDVIFQDEHMMVINKQAGLPVHPGPGHEADTLVNAILHICPDLQGIGDEIRPGIVHRLDKDTSGLILVAKTEQALNHLSDQMKNRVVRKGYIALTKGHLPKNSGIINLPIGRHPKDRKKMTVIGSGREAITEFSVLDIQKDMSLVELILHTGRTHQIRVHLSHMGCKIICDSVYGGSTKLIKRQFLHAYKISFTHPVHETHQSFVAELPQELDHVAKELGFDPDNLGL